MENNSKVISKVDESSKKFIIECLNNNNTGGFDIDSIYRVGGKWHIFEYLKCNKLSPIISNPKYYPFNWRKFYSLYSIVKALDADFYLVNYSNKEAWRNQIKLMQVMDFDLEKVKNNTNNHCEYMELKETLYTREEFLKWLIDLNNKALKEKI